jgi:hypothetical protein
MRAGCAWTTDIQHPVCEELVTRGSRLVRFPAKNCEFVSANPRAPV